MPSFKAILPSKHHQNGVKMFALCDVEIVHTMGFIIYTGSETKKECDE